MSKDFTIEVKGLDALIDMAEKYPAISEKHINGAIKNSLIRIQDQAKKNAPSGDTQQLRQNWNLTMGRFYGSLESGARNKGFSYGIAVEFGRSPGKPIPVKDNPMFQLWATRRGLNPYAVSKSIQKKGTKGRPFFKKSIDGQKENVDREFDKALSGIMESL